MADEDAGARLDYFSKNMADTIMMLWHACFAMLPSPPLSNPALLPYELKNALNLSQNVQFKHILKATATFFWLLFNFIF